MSAQWTDETEALVAEALWAACFEPPRGAGKPIGPPTQTCFADARNALTALADAGLLLPASATPRVWALPTIPDDVKAVRDRDGFVWRRHVDIWRRSTGAWSEGGLNWIALNGPLIEVDE